VAIGVKTIENTVFSNILTAARLNIMLPSRAADVPPGARNTPETRLSNTDTLAR
jgi:hypothetical protein